MSYIGADSVRCGVGFCDIPKPNEVSEDHMNIHLKTGLSLSEISLMEKIDPEEYAQLLNDVNVAIKLDIPVDEAVSYRTGGDTEKELLYQDALVASHLGEDYSVEDAAQMREDADPEYMNALNDLNVAKTLGISVEDAAQLREGTLEGHEGTPEEQQMEYQDALVASSFEGMSATEARVMRESGDPEYAQRLNDIKVANQLGTTVESVASIREGNTQDQLHYQDALVANELGISTDFATEMREEGDQEYGSTLNDIRVANTLGISVDDAAQLREGTLEGYEGTPEEQQMEYQDALVASSFEDMSATEARIMRESGDPEYAQRLNDIKVANQLGTTVESVASIREGSTQEQLFYQDALVANELGISTDRATEMREEGNPEYGNTLNDIRVANTLGISVEAAAQLKEGTLEGYEGTPEEQQMEYQDALVASSFEDMSVTEARIMRESGDPEYAQRLNDIKVANQLGTTVESVASIREGNTQEQLFYQDALVANELGVSTDFATEMREEGNPEYGNTLNDIRVANTLGVSVDVAAQLREGTLEGYEETPEEQKQLFYQDALVASELGVSTDFSTDLREEGNPEYGNTLNDIRVSNTLGISVGDAAQLREGTLEGYEGTPEDQQREYRDALVANVQGVPLSEAASMREQFDPEYIRTLFDVSVSNKLGITVEDAQSLREGDLQDRLTYFDAFVAGQRDIDVSEATEMRKEGDFTYLMTIIDYVSAAYQTPELAAQ